MANRLINFLFQFKRRLMSARNQKDVIAPEIDTNALNLVKLSALHEKLSDVMDSVNKCFSMQVEPILFVIIRLS